MKHEIFLQKDTFDSKVIIHLLFSSTVTTELTCIYCVSQCSTLYKGINLCPTCMLTGAVKIATYSIGGIAFTIMPSTELMWKVKKNELILQIHVWQVIKGITRGC